MIFNKIKIAFAIFLIFTLAISGSAQTGPWAQFNGTMKGQAMVRDASGGYLKDVESIVEGGGDVNWQLESGLSPMMGAASAGHLNIVQFLISKGADPLLKDKNGLTAIDYAKRGGANDVVKFLNDHIKRVIAGAQPNPVISQVVQKEPTGPWAKFNGTMKGQALVRDASGGYLKDVESIVEGGGDVNWQLESGLSPMMGAASAGHLNIVQFLVSKGADTDLKDKNGLTALDYAKRGGANDVVKYLNELTNNRNANAPFNPVLNDTAKVKVPVPVPPVLPVPPIPQPAPENTTPNNTVATTAVPWAPFGTYKVGDKVQFFAGGWKPGTIKEVGIAGNYNRKNAEANERKYLIAREGAPNWNESADWGNVTGINREPFWTGFFYGDWKLGEVMAVNTRTDGNNQRDEYSFYSATEVLNITANKKYKWKTMDGKVIKGTWRAADDGAGIVLIKAYQGVDWTLRNETNAVEENIRGLQTARLTTPGKMSIKSQRPVQ